tara:strand:+ start:286 stop:426 length:141 start_codon:yes stop_codon:yes gene_type:complete
MSEDRPYLQVPVPSEQDYQLHEEWLKRQKKELEEVDEDSGVIIIDI